MTPQSAATRGRPGIIGLPAPAWNVTHWSKLADGKDRLELRELEGKVVYLYCFQSWCPGCHSHGFPTLAKVREHYAEAEENVDDVVFVAVQTVFEGFRTNTAARGVETVEKFGLDIPVGFDAPSEDLRHPALMRSYRTGGTPWTIIIDRSGLVRFNGFRISPDRAIALIDDLLESSSSSE